MAARSAFTVGGPVGPLAGWSTGLASSGLPVMLVHPINLQARAWFRVVEWLALDDRICVMPDLRGHGRSTASGPFGLAEWTADVLAVADAFGLERFHVVGGSLGGPIAISLAAQKPDRVASVCSVGGALRIEGGEVDEVVSILRAKGVRRMFEDVIPRISVGPLAGPDTVAAVLDLVNTNDVDTVVEIWRATVAVDAGPLAGAVVCPASVITGEYDLTCPVLQGREMADALGVELQVLPGHGHLPMVEAPERLGALLAEHLYKAEAAARP